jgi:hypothetical protein
MATSDTKFDTNAASESPKTAEDTFLWVNRVMDELLKKTTASQRGKVMYSLPEGLSATYKCMLQGTGDMSDDVKSL